MAERGRTRAAPSSSQHLGPASAGSSCGLRSALGASGTASRQYVLLVHGVLTRTDRYSRTSLNLPSKQRPRRDVSGNIQARRQGCVKELLVLAPPFGLVYPGQW
jgi:hypothetical protein